MSVATLNRRVRNRVAAELRAVIYARASSDRKGRKISVASQVAAGRRYCKENGIVVVAVLRDNDMSASRYARYDRPDYAKALGLLASGQANLLWTWENSRAQRELGVFVKLRDLLIEVGGYWAYDDRVYDMNDPDDRIATAEDAVEAERESERLRKRVRRGVASRAEAGLWHGPKVFGYRKVFDQDTGEAVAMVPDEVSAPVVRWMVKELLARRSVAWVAKQLNERGVPTPRDGRWRATHVKRIWAASQDLVAWAHLLGQCTPEQAASAQEVVERVGAQREHPSWVARSLNVEKFAPVYPGVWYGDGVKSVVLNPALAGLRVHRGEVVGKGDWKALITKKQRALLIARFGDPALRARRDGPRVAHLLSGIVVCGKCELPVYHRVSANAVYSCKKGCRARRASELEAFVVESLLSRLEQAPELFRVDESSDAELVKAHETARDLRMRLDGFYSASAGGELSPAGLAKVEARLLPEIEAAERRIRTLSVAPAVALVVGPKARSAWVAMDLEERREVLRAVARPRLLPARPGRRVFDPDAVELAWLPAAV